jgi:hypothetical protein
MTGSWRGNENPLEGRGQHVRTAVVPALTSACHVQGRASSSGEYKKITKKKGWLTRDGLRCVGHPRVGDLDSAATDFSS